jgi:hypothetical protein
MYRPQTAVAPWTPLSLTNAVLYGWYKADAGVPVSTDGASVAAWADQSATPHNLTQSTPANRPVFRTAANGINGIPVLEFPSSSTTPAFFNETSFAANTNGFSFYVVSRNAAYSASAQYTGAFAIGDASAGSINQFCNVPGATTTQKIRINGASDFGESLISSNYTVTKVSRATALTSLKYQTTYTPLQIYSNTNTFAIQPGFWIGKNYVGSVGGKIAEVIVCNRELTTGDGSEEASLDAYFRSRYGFGLYYGADLPVASPALWLDASRSDTLYTDNALTTAATTDNGPVGGWKDLSGNNRHALQTGTNRPTWRTPVNGQNGLGVMSFNGLAQYFDVASLPSLANGYTFYGVIKQPTATGAVLSSASAGVDGSTAALIARPAVTAVGNAQVSTTSSKFGTGSALFDGSGDYLSVPASDACNFGTGAFTIEMFFKIPVGASGSPYGKILTSNENGSFVAGCFAMYGLASSTVFRPSFWIQEVSGSVPTLIPTTGDYRDNTWHHLAIVRQTGGAMNMYIDGTSVASATHTGNCGSSTRNLLIGHNLVSEREYAGGIADYRVSKFARYTSAFTPSAGPLPDTAATDPYFAQTSLLLHMDGANGSTVFTDSSNNVGTGITQGGKSLAQPVPSGTVVGVIGNYDGSHTSGNYFVRTSSSAANVSGVMTQTASTPATGTASIGRLTNATAYFNSQIYELVVLPRQSNSTEDQAWKTYTAAKWGVTWS